MSTRTLSSPDSPTPSPISEEPDQVRLADCLDDLPWFYYGLSALNRYHKVDSSGYEFVALRGSTVDLAKKVPFLEFPGLRDADAVAQFEEGRVYFVCLDDPSAYPRDEVLAPLNFYFSATGKKFLDPFDNYLLVKDPSWEPDYTRIGAANLPGLAVLAARFKSGLNPEKVPKLTDFDDYPGEDLKRLLSLVLSGEFAWIGLETLQKSGFLDRFFPELSPMNATIHSKEGHPEGNVWEHSLETLKYRKTRDLALSLGLFLHDCGKPHTKPNGHKMFDGHAELGAVYAKKLLRRLCFSEALVRDVAWLVEMHMMPQAISDLPLSRVEPLMEAPLFPLLLELYRCDLESTYRGPENYYLACRKFRAWLKTRKNPYLSLDRKKMIQKFVAS